MNLIQFTEDTLNNEGASYNLTTGQGLPMEGFMVSTHPELEEQIPVEQFTFISVCRFVKKVASRLTINLFIGSWTDKGIVYLDLSQHILNKEEAIFIGITGNQKAILDCANNVCINLPTPQRSGTLYQQTEYARIKARELAGVPTVDLVY